MIVVLNWLDAHFVRLNTWWLGHPGVSEPALEARVFLCGLVIFLGWLTFWTWKRRKQLTVDLFNVIPVLGYTAACTGLTMLWPWLLALTLIVAPFAGIVGGILMYARRERRAVEIACKLSGEPLPAEYRSPTENGMLSA